MLKTKSGKIVSKIGIGTWTISKDKINEEIEALKFYFEQGVNFIDVVLAYNNGTTLDVISKFIKSIKREDIFINAFITYGCDTPSDIEKQIQLYLDKLGTTYLDCITLHSLDAIKFDLNTFSNKIEQLKEKQQFLNIGYSNLSPKQLNNKIENINYFEGLYNLENKINEDNQILNICKENNIPFYAYQPLRRNRTAKQNYKEVVTLAKKYNKTQNQILINWLVKHKNIGILIKSSNKEHITEILQSINFDMSQDDYFLLDKFRNAEFDKLAVSFTNEEGKVRIDQVPNQPIGII